jgi:hypothetical protein
MYFSQNIPQWLNQINPQGISALALVVAAGYRSAATHLSCEQCNGTVTFRSSDWEWELSSVCCPISPCWGKEALWGQWPGFFERSRIIVQSVGACWGKGAVESRGEGRRQSKRRKLSMSGKERTRGLCKRKHKRQERDWKNWLEGGQ